MRVLVIVILFFLPHNVRSHEEEMSPLQRMQLWEHAEAKVSCSSILMKAFPDNDLISQFGYEIIEDSIISFDIAFPERIDIGHLIFLTNKGVSIWDKSDEKGRENILRICGSELLKEEVKDKLIPEPYLERNM